MTNDVSLVHQHVRWLLLPPAVISSDSTSAGSEDNSFSAKVCWLWRSTGSNTMTRKSCCKSMHVARLVWLVRCVVGLNMKSRGLKLRMITYYCCYFSVALYEVNIVAMLCLCRRPLATSLVQALDFHLHRTRRAQLYMLKQLDAFCFASCNTSPCVFTLPIVRPHTAVVTALKKQSPKLLFACGILYGSLYAASTNLVGNKIASDRDW